jgi:hypothetical protein
MENLDDKDDVINYRGQRGYSEKEKRREVTMIRTATFTGVLRAARRVQGREERSSSPLKEVRRGCSVEMVEKGNGGRRGRALFKEGTWVHRAPGLCIDGGGGSSRWLVEQGGTAARARGGAVAWKLACVAQGGREGRHDGEELPATCSTNDLACVGAGVQRWRLGHGPWVCL